MYQQFIGTVICIIAAMAGDTSRGFKDRLYRSATPDYLQQIGELIGAIGSILAIESYVSSECSIRGFSSDQILQPQATLMKMVVEGVMWWYITMGIVFMEHLSPLLLRYPGIPVLAFSIGLGPTNLAVHQSWLVELFVGLLTTRKIRQ